jgi:16S rRNA (guanine966-N2)-methyltransferase
MARRSNVRRTPPGSVRIIGGQWRSRRLAIAEGTAVRPTPDRVRETVFNWLRDVIADARCLDLYAGTGALGLEALSRGAAEAVFVERDPVLIATLRAHAATLGVEPVIVRQDAESFLHGVAPAPFDIVFLDPPYDRPVEPLLELLPRWLQATGVVYVERPRTPGLPEVPGGVWRKRGRAGAVEYGLLELTAPRAGAA